MARVVGRGREAAATAPGDQGGWRGVELGGYLDFADYGTVSILETEFLFIVQEETWEEVLEWLLGTTE